MILLHVKQTFENREAMMNYYRDLCASGIPEKSRAEHGNIAYDYFFAADADNVMLLVEQWESADALAAHQQTAHFKSLPAVKAPYRIDSAIERFEL